MTINASRKSKRKQKKDPDLVNAEIALKRAARKAREIARMTGTSVIVIKDGEIREERYDKPAH